MTESERKDFLTLVSAACNAALPVEDQKRLDGYLKDHAEARREWLVYCRLHVELGLHSRAGAIAQRLAERVKANAAQANSSATPDQEETYLSKQEVPTKATVRKQDSPQSLRVLITAGVLAASLLMAFLITSDERPAAGSSELGNAAPSDATPEKRTAKRRPEVVALMHRPSANKNTVDEQSIPQVLLAGEEVFLAEGKAHLKMTDGAALFVEGPVRMRLVTASHVRLLEGSLSAQLSKWAKGFVVDTNAMRLVDLGTTFAVTAESATVAEAQVLEGLVKIQPREHEGGSLTSFLLNEGESVRVNGAQAIRKQVNLDSDSVKQRIKTLASIESYRPIPMHSTGIDLHEGEEDPFWRIQQPANQDGALPASSYAVVCKPHDRYSENEPELSQWISVFRDNDPLLPNASYTFSTKIDLTGYDLRTVRIVGQVLADNGVKEIRINNQPIDRVGWLDNVGGQEFSRNEFHVIEIDSGFQTGMNLIEIVVRNGGEYRARARLEMVPNPMALRVEWQGFGRPLDP